MIPLNLCLEMSIIITTNCTNGKITRTNAIPTEKLESNVSKYHTQTIYGSAETSTVPLNVE